MIIGIDASRAFLKRRTGIEEYSYQVIRHLREVVPADHTVKLYLRSDQTIDFDLPSHWQVRRLFAPRLWTQGRLSLEMFLHPPDVLFVPAHTVPLIHPRRTVVTIHGLEYEFCPESYGFWERFYMRLSIRFSCLVAEKIIAVSENTKRDLVRLYRVPEDKITVIYEGGASQESRVESGTENSYSKSTTQESISRLQTLNSRLSSLNPYLLFIGRLEERKNITRIIEAFERFKAKTGLSHQLVLAGKPGFGYKKAKVKRQKAKVADDIIELGYVTAEEKQELLRRATVFLFPSLYEGFGLPVLEAQAAGVPVITSTTSSLPEVAGEGAVLVDPLDTGALARAMEKLVADDQFRAGIIQKGRANHQRFGWEKTAAKLKEIIGVVGHV